MVVRLLGKVGKGERGKGEGKGRGKEEKGGEGKEGGRWLYDVAMVAGKVKRKGDEGKEEADGDMGCDGDGVQWWQIWRGRVGREEKEKGVGVKGST
ncbi:hypothetical protein Droror1_Dr00021575 [Drosera rotundifolia]